MAEPILADLFGKTLREAETRATPEQRDAALKVLAEAYKYVFPQRLTEMAEEAVSAPEDLAPFLSMPANWTWIEFHDGVIREGALINCMGDPDLKTGSVIYIVEEKAKVALEITAVPIDLLSGGLTSHDIPVRFQKRFMGAITLLGAPDLLERKKVEHSRKFNERREQAGKHPFHDHEVVNLYLTRYEKEQEQEWAEEQRQRGIGFLERGHKRRHFVRAHIRILGDGRVIKVAPHYRGDAALGEVPRVHVVRA